MEAEELRSRSTLHLNKLEEFTRWLQGKGWTLREPKGCYEALRMTHKGKYGRKTLLVHRKDSATEHLTTQGVSALAVRQWLKEKKSEFA